MSDEFWPVLKGATPARIGLGRSGVSLTTARQLEFQLAHAAARDAVYDELNHAELSAALEREGFSTVLLHSAAGDRATYLRRPDLGRRLDENSREKLMAVKAESVDLVIVIADGLSATAVNRWAAELVVETIKKLTPEIACIAPIVLVEQGRVAVGDEIGELLGAKTVAVLIGERPGLSAADSLGVYVTFEPRVGRVDAERNCISNVRAEGLTVGAAAEQLAGLVADARRLGCTGVAMEARRMSST